MKPVSIPPPPPVSENKDAWLRTMHQSLLELTTYWNQGIDANVLRADAVNSDMLDWPLLAPYGKVDAPSYSFELSPKTGFYGIGLNNLGLTINGTKLLDYSSALMALTGAMTISTTLTVTGNIIENGILSLNGNPNALSFGAASAYIVPGSTSLIIRNNANNANNFTFSDAGAFTLVATTDATNITSGTIITAGGVGITKALWVGGLADITGAVNMRSTMTIASTLTVSGGGTHSITGKTTITRATGSDQFRIIDTVGAVELYLQPAGSGAANLYINRIGADYNIYTGVSGALDTLALALTSAGNGTFAGTLRANGYDSGNARGIYGTTSFNGQASLLALYNSHASGDTAIRLSNTAYDWYIINRVATGSLIFRYGSDLATLTSGGNLTLAGTLTVSTLGARVAGDVYVICDANGVFHKSAVGPAS